MEIPRNPTTGKSVGKPRLPESMIARIIKPYHREIGREATAEVSGFRKGPRPLAKSDSGAIAPRLGKPEVPAGSRHSGASWIEEYDDLPISESLFLT
jgi:hypothetical protein